MDSDTRRPRGPDGRLEPAHLYEEEFDALELPNSRREKTHKFKEVLPRGWRGLGR